MNIPKLEEEIIKRWNSIKAFEKSVKNRAKARSFVFYEGPPTANGMPGFHHVEARSYKDIICRYKTMRGFRVERRAGWDTHGLPVEVQVEKELGLNSKKDIEDYGIAKFNEKCRQSVWRYKQDWETLTERMAFWLDMEDPYITYDPLYMESLWHIIKEAHKKELLYEGHKVVPRCSRCGTTLSSHEVAQGYEDVTDESVFVKFKVKSPTSHQLPTSTYFLAWTTTPWTLPGNVALAVGPKIKYSLVRRGSEHYILATDRLEVLEDDYDTVKELEAQELEGLRYEPLFDSLKDARGEKYKVVSVDFVDTEEGTGIVHTAVMYGEEDYALAEEHNLPKVHTVDEEGKFNKLVPEFEGKFVKDADEGIIARLKADNLLYKAMPYEHSYPFCWRCDTPLLYYAIDSWFIKMSRLKKDLIAANKKINWVPAHLKEGRFGDWLEGLKDWAFSRSRYWGTPLPVWKCKECDHKEVAGSRNDLRNLYKKKNTYYTLRHGQAESNAKGIIVSEENSNKKFGLTEKGKKEAAAASKKLKKENIDLIITSPLSRTKETAEIVAKALGVPVKEDSRMLEVKAGIFEKKAVKEYRNYFKAAEEKYYKKVPKGESFADVQKRSLELVTELEREHSDKKIILVGHEATIFALHKGANGFTLDEARAFAEKNPIKTGSSHKLDYALFPHNKEGKLDFHRPFVDKIQFPCTKCEKGKMQRVEDLVDVWFDSGCMPFAQSHYPFENKNAIQKGTKYPADYIAEAIDQTRGWFYTLLAVSAIMDKAPSYKNVITLGIVLDDKGKKMSKSKGNIVDPIELAGKYGMDAVRLYFFTVNGPAEAKRFTEKDVKEKLHKFVLTFANSLTFLQTYAPGIKPPKKFASKNILDRWIYARVKELSARVAKNLDAYNVLDAARAVDSFVVEDLSNWYIRRSRGRMQKPRNKAELEEAAKTLAYTLNELSKITAPFTPFIAEHIWQSLNTEAKSVHWENYPSLGDLTKTEKQLLDDMARVREWSAEGLRMRSTEGLKVRQPLQSFTVPVKLSKDMQEILKDELNVKEIKIGTKPALDTKLSEALKIEGEVREIIRNIQRLRKDAGLKPQDKVMVEYSLPPALRGRLGEWTDYIAESTNADKLNEGQLSGTYDADAEFNLDAKHKVNIGIRKL